MFLIVFHGRAAYYLHDSSVASAGRGDNSMIAGATKVPKVLASKMLAGTSSDLVMRRTEPSVTPRVFLGYMSEDARLAKRIAEPLEAVGMVVSWDKWLHAGRGTQISKSPLKPFRGFALRASQASLGFFDDHHAPDCPE